MLYYEDMVPGETLTGATFVVDEKEMVEFAQRWDPVPFHVDRRAGEAAFGSLTAPGIFVLAVKQHLIHQLDEKHAVIASLGYDDVRFHHPVRPGDAVTLLLEWVDRRVSQSKPDRGVVTLRLGLTNQDATLVMSHLDTILVRRRPSS
jgi:acyl dehydratase